MSALCVIPARGGSKRIARKNMRDFAGAPMLSFALRAAQDSGVFNHIHVSTDDDEIASVAAQFGAKPAFLRAQSLADDFTPVRDVVRSDLAEFEARGSGFDAVALVYATAALLNPADLRAAMAEFLKERSRPLLAVVPAPTPLERFMAVSDGVLEPALSKDRFSGRTQDLTPVFSDAGAFAFYSADTLRADRDGAAAMDFRPFVLAPHQAVDIDTESDWRHAEVIKAGLQALEG